ncbi:MAG: hypothetical protein Kow0026_07700 [Oricola sp.]
MVSIQGSSYGVSALVSSQMPSASKNCETGPGQNRHSDSAAAASGDGASPAGGPHPVDPAPDTEKAADPADERDTALAILGTDEDHRSRETEAPSWEEFQAATRHHEEIVDLREADEAGESEEDSGGVSFDEAGTYRPAWIK